MMCAQYSQQIIILIKKRKKKNMNRTWVTWDTCVKAQERRESKTNMQHIKNDTYMMY